MVHLRMRQNGLNDGVRSYSNTVQLKTLKQLPYLSNPLIFSLLTLVAGIVFAVVVGVGLSIAAIVVYLVVLCSLARATRAIPMVIAPDPELFLAPWGLAQSQEFSYAWHSI